MMPSAACVANMLVSLVAQPTTALLSPPASSSFSKRKASIAK